jgi:surface protein
MGTIFMKQINTYINEKLRLTSKYSCHPKDKYELTQIIIERIVNDGLECDLNDIDVSKITDMGGLFDANSNKAFKKFNGDISLWNVSNVENMRDMFFGCIKFNGDISLWDVSNVKDMYGMFCECGRFNCDLSSWNVSNVENMNYMFEYCKRFKCDLSSWDVSNVELMICAFHGCPTQSKWYGKNKWDQ